MIHHSFNLFSREFNLQKFKNVICLKLLLGTKEN